MNDYPNALFFYDGNAIFREMEVNGERYTLGTMLKGKYRWIADNTETFSIKQGSAALYVDNEENKIGEFGPGDTFSVEVSSDGSERYFWIEVFENLDYMCRISA